MARDWLDDEQFEAMSSFGEAAGLFETGCDPIRIERMPADEQLDTLASGYLISSHACGAVAQFGRAPRSQCGGQGFDPPLLHQLTSFSSITYK